MKRKSIGILVVLVIALLLSACSSNDKLVGTWESEGMGTGYTFTKDGTVTQDLLGLVAMEGTYEVKGSSLIMTFYGVATTYQYKISGKTLTIGADPVKLVFTRVD